MNLSTKTKFLMLLKEDIKKSDKQLDYKEVERSINIIETVLGFRLEANKLREEYYIKSA